VMKNGFFNFIDDPNEAHFLSLRSAKATVSETNQTASPCTNSPNPTLLLSPIVHFLISLHTIEVSSMTVSPCFLWLNLSKNACKSQFFPDASN